MLAFASMLHRRAAGMSNTPEQRQRQDVEGLGWIVGGLLVFALGCWFVPAVVTVLWDHRLPQVTIPDAVASIGRLVGDGRWGDPASAYPGSVRRTMPAAAGWWAAVAWCLALTGAIVAAVMRHVEPHMAAERLGRRSFDWRGSRPRPWARPRDLRLDDPGHRGFSVGRLDGRRLWTDEEAHIAVIAPTRAGKTTRCVIPWLLEHEGPAIVTSTKRDVLDATREHRSRIGTVWVFDPFGDDCATWTPLVGCESWSYALRQAQWLADASSDGNNEIARFWRGEAAKLLAPLLHAAALESRDMTDVLTWVDVQDFTEPTKVLLVAGADAAALQLKAIRDLDGRNRGTTVMSASAVLAGYRYPEVAALSGDDITVDEFLHSPAHTLYIVAAERHQRLLAPLVVSLISSLVNGVAEDPGNAWGGRRLRILLDEAANVAPLSELPRMLSQAAGHGVRFATIWQSVAQLRERHGAAADTVLANSTTKLFMGPVGDEATRRLTDRALRSIDDTRKSSLTQREIGGGLQHLQTGRALLLMGHRTPGIVELETFFESRRHRGYAWPGLLRG